MGEYVRVAFFDRHGAPLIVAEEETEPLPYCRTLMGFTAPRGIDERPSGSPVVRPSDESDDGEDAEGIQLEVQEEEAEEDEP